MLRVANRKGRGAETVAVAGKLVEVVEVARNVQLAARQPDFLPHGKACAAVVGIVVHVGIAAIGGILNQAQRTVETDGIEAERDRGQVALFVILKLEQLALKCELLNLCSRRFQRQHIDNLIKRHRLNGLLAVGNSTDEKTCQ